jgi:uncharacterized membrane protein YphA (DoxX/SURF4 family)
MSTMTTRGVPAGETARPRWVNLACWVVQAALALVFAGAGASKLFGEQAMVDLFADVGVGQWFRYVVGALEVAGAVGLLVSRLCGLAALSLAAIMAGAVVMSATRLDDPVWVPLGLLVVTAIVAAIRWPRTAALLGRA